MTNTTCAVDLEAISAVGTTFRAAADRAETARTMPDDVVAAARSAGLFRMAMPRSLGGSELDPVEIIKVVEMLSAGDGSAGWTVLIGNSTAFFAWLQPEAARAMVASADVISTSMFAPMGTARREGSEFVIDGRWPFNSGCAHADWYQTSIVVTDGDRPALRPDGRPDLRFAFFPSREAEIIDTWHSLGLRGTGSHDISVRGLRVPVEHTAAPMLDVAADTGALFRLGFFSLLGVLMSGFPLGVARRALDEFATLAPSKRRGANPCTVAEDPRVQHEMGRAEAAVQSARAFVLDTVAEAWEVILCGSALTPQQAARIGLATQQAMHAAVGAVDIAYQFAGARAVYTGHPLERCFRDIHTANQHIAFSGEGFAGYAKGRFEARRVASTT